MIRASLGQQQQTGGSQPAKDLRSLLIRALIVLQRFLWTVVVVGVQVTIVVVVRI